MASSNTYVKRANKQSEYTPDLIQELAKCIDDPIYCIKTYFYIQHPKHGRVIFKLYDYQEELIRCVHNNRDVIVLASRQMGKCFSKSTKINVYKKPGWFKMSLLYLLDRKTHAEVSKL